ncbi:hypothetical protein HanRHA438_Chr05g0205531 [Helianthus annuus]|nr:hypothetical protein HanHA89_Chr05g0174611 [Helianthus annuus]KAJ0749002.1 hypothetical protein HanLR1_Chr05g0164821 [Helianthus annuus]KAJ0917398.1 hypothetical protein HanRHA438_Chr05g0205531 [Helianthus annuus]KAJ0921249.1 hypothetical protein HanPSC8_Chr05g0189321 [Helianthus annuus]
MVWVAVLWIIFVIVNVLIIISNVFQLVFLAELEDKYNYRNPYETSTLINNLVVFEMVLHGVCCGIFLVTGHWFMFQLTFTFVIYNTILFFNGQHLIDVTTHFGSFKANTTYQFVKLAFYWPLLVVVIDRMVTWAWNT